MATQTMGVGSGIGTPDQDDIQTWWDLLDDTLTEPEQLDILWASSANEIVLSDGLQLTGVTASSSNTITIRAATGDSIMDDPSNPLRYDASLGACIRLPSGIGSFTLLRTTATWLTIERLQFKKTVNYGSIIEFAGSDNTVLDSCILNISGTSDGNIVNTPAAGNNLVLKNNIMYNNGSPWAGASGVFFWGGNIQSYNNIVAYTGSSPNGIGIDHQYATPVIKNTVVFGWPTDTNNQSGSVSGTNNATDKTSFAATGYGGGTPQTSIDPADEFMSVTSGSEDFRLKSTAPQLINTGTSSGTPTVDCFGQTRDANPDIGPYEFVSGGGAVTLDAAQGTYSVTGQAARLLRGRRLVAAQGTYSITGQSAGLKYGRKLGAAQGSYLLTGQLALLKRGLKVPAAQGSYSLNGQDANLIAPTAKVLPANQGTYQISGQDARLTLGRKVSAAQGSYSLTGQVALLRKSYTALPAGQGSYTLSGQSAAFLRTTKMPAAQGQYNLFGQAATLSYSGEIQPEGFDWLLRYRRKRR